MNPSKMVRLAGNIVFLLLMATVVLTTFFLIKSKIGGGVPEIAGKRVYIVLSGSMSPVFDAGSVVLDRTVDPKLIRKGDIVTFKDPSDSNRVITHRVAEIKEVNGQRSFVTKGDANNGIDTTPVPTVNVLGRTEGSIPYLGYLLAFARSKTGFFLMIVLPGALLIFNELWNLFKAAAETDKEEEYGPGYRRREV